MKSPLKKIGVILIIILLPALAYSIYVLSSLNRDEEAISQIYSRQLDAILYSVNRYSEDVINTWANRIEENYTGPALTNPAALSKFLMETPIELVITGDTTLAGISPHSPGTGLDDISDAENSLKSNREVIKKLFGYHKAGYRKIENIPLSSGRFLLVFFSGDSADTFHGIVITPSTFIRRVLASKLQEMTQDQFIITVFNSSGQIYSTEEVDLNELDERKQLWFFSDTYLGIMLKGPTIENLIHQRTQLNIILIVIMNLILLAGIWFVFRNIKKEIELAQIKSDFVSNVSHELRTPLALINMFAETLEMGRVRTETKKQEYYSIISQEANRLSRIVNKILSFSRMEAGKVKYNFSCTDLNDIIDNILKNYTFHLQNNGFRHILEKDESLPCVSADPEAVQEAVINLLDNAVKYSKDEKLVEIRTGVKDSRGYVEVTDHGVGISSADQKKVFEKFFRVSSGLIHSTKGTGLGLTLVKHIMEAHKGSIELKSEPGKGSTFRLYFNIYNPEKK